VLKVQNLYGQQLIRLLFFCIFTIFTFEMQQRTDMAGYGENSGIITRIFFALLAKDDIKDIFI
ncbi:MAG: hypothetical protein Q4C77_19855, partial [Eubacteriales bacterium]|nr:hypothetical protein [Eubacteriales bacterium]